MARQYQSQSHDIKKPSKSYKKGSEKVKKERVLSVGFILSSLILAIIFFFISFIIGIELGPNFPF